MLRGSVVKSFATQSSKALHASVAGVLSAKPVFTVPSRGARISADELRNNFVIEWEGKRMVVTGFHAAMMGRRPTSLHVELKDTATGKTYPVRFNPSDRVERIELDNVEYQYLYTEGDISYAMHPATFEQVEFESKLLGNRVHYAVPDSALTLSFYQGKIFSVSTPEYAFLKVQDTEAYTADSNNNAATTKPAVLENGRTVKVARFVNNGDLVKIRVDGEEFVSRATPADVEAYAKKMLARTRSAADHE